jgi:hypothetical protein
MAGTPTKLAEQPARRKARAKRVRPATMTAAWSVENETRIDHVVMHLESLHFAIAMTESNMDVLKDELGRAVARLVQLKPDCMVELAGALTRAQEQLAKLEAGDDAGAAAVAEQPAAPR